MGRRLDDLLVRGVGMAVGDVVADGAGEQHAFLRNVAHPIGQFVARELGDVGTVEQNAAAGRPVQALQHLQQGRLAGPVAPDKGVNAARGQAYGDVAEDRLGAFDVIEDDVLRAQLALGRFQFDLGLRAFAGRIKGLPQTLSRLLE